MDTIWDHNQLSDSVAEKVTSFTNSLNSVNVVLSNSLIIIKEI